MSYLEYPTQQIKYSAFPARPQRLVLPVEAQGWEISYRWPWFPPQLEHIPCLAIQQRGWGSACVRRANVSRRQKEQSCPRAAATSWEMALAGKPSVCGPHGIPVIAFDRMAYWPFTSRAFTNRRTVKKSLQTISKHFWWQSLLLHIWLRVTKVFG